MTSKNKNGRQPKNNKNKLKDNLKKRRRMEDNLKKKGRQTHQPKST